MGTSYNMLSPPRSPYYTSVSPPLTNSVLKLQKLGLELGPAASKSSLQIPSYNTSQCSTPSDMDKPLPLEPFETRRRRTSSHYSNETTISDIIDMYGGVLEEEFNDASHYYNVQAYRDTVAPLMARRLSLTHSTWVPPIIPHRLRTSVSSPIMRAAEISPEIQTADSKNAPSFAEFSRNLRERRQDMVSPFSTDSYEQHRQEALEKLAPPSPQDSSEALNVAYEQPQSYLPGPMSGTITDVMAPEYVPGPLDLSRTSRAVLSPQQAARQAQAEQLEYPPPHFQQPDTTQSWARVMDKLNKRKSTEEREKQRVLNYASEKYPGMKSSALRKASERSSGSSISQRATNIMSVISGAGSKGDKTPGSAPTPRRQKQLAVKTTPYQEFGPDVWLPPEKQEKKKKKDERKMLREREEEEKKRHRRNRSSANSKASRGSDLSGAYHRSSQNQIFGAIKGRLSRSASERRREQLKKNIVLLGPTKLTKEKYQFEGAGGWK